MRRRFMERGVGAEGGLYYYTVLPRGGEGRGVGTERENIPFPLPLLCLYRSHTGGGELCFFACRSGGGREGGVLLKGV